LREGYVFQANIYFWDAPRGTSAKDVPLPANVICLQNHDQVGNRAQGERLTALIPRGARKWQPRCCCWRRTRPFCSWTGVRRDSAVPVLRGFQDPALKKAVSEGRRSEFKDFNFSEVPDPEDPATFERSKLTWANGPENREMLEWYRRLLQLRSNTDSRRRHGECDVRRRCADDAGTGS